MLNDASIDFCSRLGRLCSQLSLAGSLFVFTTSTMGFSPAWFMDGPVERRQSWDGFKWDGGQKERVGLNLSSPREQIIH